MSDPLTTISTRRTPQSEPIPGTVPNSAGGHAYAIDVWKRLDRFLILGTEGGTYYISERKLTVENAQVVFDALDEDPQLVIERIVEISTSGRAPKPNPAIFALAVASSHENVGVRQRALAYLNNVCRIGTHLFAFVGYVEQFRGWGPQLQKAVSRWYLDRPPDALARQVTKYKGRGGWTHRDVIRLAKPKPERGSEHDRILAWVAGKSDGRVPYLDVIDHLPDMTFDEIVGAIRVNNLPWEVLPSERLADPRIWRALVGHMGLTAMLRNLGRMTANGALTPMSETEATVIGKITDVTAMKNQRVHPLQVLTSEGQYRKGQGMRGSLSWRPTAPIMTALDTAFYASFELVEPANKRILLALDVSGSMAYGSIAGSPLTPREASGALALVTASVEPSHHIVGFQSTVVPLAIHKGMSLPDVTKAISNLPFGSTDCSAAIDYAYANNIGVDCFVMLTDSETWVGRSHPSQALVEYRRKTGIDAKLIIVGMTSNGFSLADPSDAGMLDVIGFDTATPRLISDFAANRL